MSTGIGKLKLKRPSSTISSISNDSIKKSKGISSNSTASTTTASTTVMKTDSKLEVKDKRTKTEIAFEKKLVEREEKNIGKKLSKSHREKIQEFNQRLATMPEHNDIPRVGPG